MQLTYLELTITNPITYFILTSVVTFIDLLSN